MSIHHHLLLFSNEPARLHSFIEQMVDPQSGFEFLTTDPVFHLISQTHILSVAQVDLQFVLKAEKLDTAYNFLAKKLCPDSLKIVDELPRVNRNRSPRPELKGLDEDTLNLLRRHYKQDSDCFGY